jgi:hypothetical protein
MHFDHRGPQRLALERDARRDISEAAHADARNLQAASMLPRVATPASTIVVPAAVRDTPMRSRAASAINCSTSGSASALTLGLLCESEWSAGSCGEVIVGLVASVDQFDKTRA